MFRFIIVSILTATLVLSLTVEKKESYESYNKLDYDLNEDYGCVHENHSQYDDGDSLNLHLLRK